MEWWIRLSTDSFDAIAAPSTVAQCAVDSSPLNLLLPPLPLSPYRCHCSAALDLGAQLCWLLAKKLRPTQQSGPTYTWWWFSNVAPKLDGSTASRGPARRKALARKLQAVEPLPPAEVLPSVAETKAWEPPTGDWPFLPIDFARRDEQPDQIFYGRATYQSHVDAAGLAALTCWYSQLPAFKRGNGVAILDLASSWQSHYPPQWRAPTGGRVVGVGMSLAELQRNPHLTEHVVQDLNSDPILAAFDDGSFDLVTCALSIDYFTDPRAVLREAGRVLRPGGTIALSFSNRCFPTKVVQMWLETNDAGHIYIVGAYIKFCSRGLFGFPFCHDISPAPGSTDPMYVVEATKL